MVTLNEELKNRELEVRKYIENYSTLFELDANLVRALITQESRFLGTAVSPTKAYGYGQFTTIGANQVQNVAALTPKAADLRNFTKADADDPDQGIKAVCATLWWLYYRKYGEVEDKKVRLEACLTFYNAGGKAAALVVTNKGHTNAIPHIRQLEAKYQAQAAKYTPEVLMWYVAWHEEFEKQSAPVEKEEPGAPATSNPFDSRVSKLDVRYRALVEALKLLADEDPNVESTTLVREGLTELTLIFPGEY